eukprot:GHRQ01024408.1.p1 GENE.GHRQ01024408.1~~GHRQ01024408.1.p1  ORF type:complete len:311 (+),score=118.51 GHRQ01024408.1:33-935(+)
MELDEGAVEQQQQQQVEQQPDLQQQVQEQQQPAEVVQQQPHAELLKCRYPHVPAFLSYIRNRRLVTFRRLDDPKEPGLQLELLQDDDYDTVTAALAGKLGAGDASQLRLTQHNAYSNMPQRTPMKYRGVAALHQMLQHANHATDTLYYELLDMPLQQLEQLKSLRVRRRVARAAALPAALRPACYSWKADELRAYCLYCQQSCATHTTHTHSGCYLLLDASTLVQLLSTRLTCVSCTNSMHALDVSTSHLIDTKHALRLQCVLSRITQYPVRLLCVAAAAGSLPQRQDGVCRGARGAAAA